MFFVLYKNKNLLSSFFFGLPKKLNFKTYPEKMNETVWTNQALIL
jgi:hypothetical protein